MLERNIFETSQSTCPKCLERIEARLIEQEGKIYFNKICPAHGEVNILISEHAQEYKALRAYYFKLMDRCLPQQTYMLYLTDKCNLSCPICSANFKGCEGVLDLSWEEIKEIVDDNPGKNFFLCGAEPSTRKDLVEVIRLLKMRQGEVFLYSNGLNFTNLDYVKKLKAAGLDKVYLSFDGFNDEIYETLRGEKLLATKMKVLEILKAAGVSVMLCAVLLKEVNVDQIKRLFDYALANDFICELDLVPYLLAGESADYLPDSFFMPHEVIDLVEEQTAGFITRQSIFLFQKFLYAYMAFLNRRICLAYNTFWLYREKGNQVIPIDRLLDLKSVESKLDTYADFFTKNRILARAYFLWILLILGKNLVIKHFALSLQLGKMLCLHVFRKNIKTRKSGSKFFKILFSSCCDATKIDFRITDYCAAGMVWKNNKGKVCWVDGLWEYILERENKTG